MAPASKMAAWARGRVTRRRARPGRSIDSCGSSAEAPDAALVAQRLTTITLHLLRRLAREEQVTGIRPARLSALATLGGWPPTLGGLARRERVTPPSMTRLVQALEGDGLVGACRAPRTAERSGCASRRPANGSSRSAVWRERIAGWLRPLLDDDQLRVVDTAVTLLEGSLRDAE